MDRNLKETAVRNSNEIHENDGVLDLRQQKRAHSPGLVELRVGLLLLRLERGDIRGLVLSRFDIGVQ